ncbi:YihY/virulence factor BrkB family protein [Telluribacter sp. SYSU D00476]|uniref:YihY/virulence factor BrkB family protein n=1 Tax=Telluribacter sp. SYSU D00476 TaxID=2811430 RepID=UPI001FF56BC7|nr:YihY/virulence factor BrkB family protein [Telluribacter sp. SYSU D00476]
MKKALIVLKQNDPLRMAGATAFFTTFALPPILIILVQLFGLIINPTTLSSQLIKDIGAIIGKEGAAQINLVIENIRALNKEWYVALGGFLFLMVIATTLFSVVKNSLDQIWSIRVKDKPGLKFRLKLRLRSLGIILLAGLLFIIGVLSEGLMALIGNYLVFLLPDNSMIVNYLINELFFIAIVTIWFCILFRYLTDGRPDWNLALMGGFFTAVLLNGGKLILRWLLTYNNISTIYGASGSIVLIMLFVFYSSIIFYYGGAFIKVLSDTQRKPIRPIRKAYRYELYESKVEEKPHYFRPKT